MLNVITQDVFKKCPEHVTDTLNILYVDSDG